MLFPDQLEQLQQLNDPWGSKPHPETSARSERTTGVYLEVFVPPDLIYCGRKLRDDQTLDFYGIQSGSTVHVLRKSWPEPDQKPGEE